MATEELNPAVVAAGVSSLIARLEDTLEPIFGRLIDHAADALETVDRRVLPVASRAMDAATVNLPHDDADGPLDWSAFHRLMGHADASIRAVEDANQSTLSSITDQIHSLIGDVLPDIPTILAKAIEVFGQLVAVLAGDIAEVGELWSSLYDTLKARLPADNAGINEFISAVMLSVLTRSVQPFTDLDVHTLQNTPGADLDIGRPKPTGTEFTNVFESYNPFVRNIAYIFVQVMTAYQHLAALASGSISLAAQSGLAETLPTPLSPPALAELVRRRDVGIEWATDQAKRSGMSSGLFDLQYLLTQRFLDTQAIVELWRRTGDDANLDDLYRMGYSTQDVDRLKYLAFAIPTPSDLVRFMVRDVFDPAAIERGKLDAEFDDKVRTAPWQQVGITLETLKLYWMAHWTLPSPTQVFEMIHREQLTVEEGRQALAQADYAPAYIEKYINIAYNVPGRIDVRRMWETGVITDRADLVKRYRFMGYNADDAETLARFTEALVKKSKDAEAERHRSPIAHEVVRSYVARALTESQARDSLIALGYSTDAADYKLREGEYSRQRDRADRIRTSIHSQYTKGFLSEDETVSRLSQYGFGDEEITELLESWHLDLELAHDAEERKHQKDLSKSEVLAGYGERLMSRDDAAGMLLSLGYDATETETLLALEDTKLRKADNRVAEAAIHTLYVTRRTTEEETRNALLQLGYLPDRVEHLMMRWVVEREEKAPDIPTAQLEKLLFQGVVPLEQLTEELRRRGYSDRDVLWLSTMWGTDVSIAGDKLAEQRRQFELREERLNRAQQGVNERFQAGIQSRQTLQRERLDAQQALVTRKLASQVERDAQQFENRQALQERTIAASADRLAKQIDAARARQEEALQLRRDLAAQAEQVRRDAIAAQDARQARQLNAQADRLERQIQATDARAAAAQSARERLADIHATHQEHLAVVRSQLTEARDVRQNAARIAQEQRQEASAVRREGRAAARQDIRTADAAQAKEALRALQLERDRLTAQLNEQLAGLEAQSAQIRQQQALAQRQAAEQALAANTPTTTLLESGI